MMLLRSRQAGARLSGASPCWRRWLATPVAGGVPQTYVEKVVQRHAVGLGEGAVVKAGDYVMIKPEHVMTHVSQQ